MASSHPQPFSILACLQKAATVCLDQTTYERSLAAAVTLSSTTVITTDQGHSRGPITDVVSSAAAAAAAAAVLVTVGCYRDRTVSTHIGQLLLRGDGAASRCVTTAVTMTILSTSFDGRRSRRVDATTESFSVALSTPTIGFR